MSTFITGPCSLGSDCKCPTAELDPQYKCYFCRAQLHSCEHGCSFAYGDENDGNVICLPQNGRLCRRNASDVEKVKSEATPPALPPALPDQEWQDSSDAQDSTATTPPKSEPIESTPESQTKETKKIEEVVKTPPGPKQRGRKPGSGSALTITNGDWYNCCKAYRQLDDDEKMSAAQFLRSNKSSSLFKGTRSQQSSFGKFLRKFDAGMLEDSKVIRCKRRKFVVIEKKLIDYVMYLREQQHKSNTIDKKAGSWASLKAKCTEWAAELGVLDFKASEGWLSSTFKRYGIKQVINDQKYTHLEAMEAMEVVRAYMRHNDFPKGSFTTWARLRSSMQKEKRKGEEYKPLSPY